MATARVAKQRTREDGRHGHAAGLKLCERARCIAAASKRHEHARRCEQPLLSADSTAVRITAFMICAAPGMLQCVEALLT